MVRLSYLTIFAALAIWAGTSAVSSAFQAGGGGGGAGGGGGGGGQAGGGGTAGAGAQGGATGGSGVGAQGGATGGAATGGGTRGQGGTFGGAGVGSQGTGAPSAAPGTRGGISGGVGVGAQGGATGGVQPGSPGVGPGRIGSGQPGAIGSAELNRNRNAGGISRNPWFADPSVRRQLNLNDDQFNRLNRSYMDNFNRFQQAQGQLGSDANEQLRAQRMRELEGTFRQNFSSSLNDVFTDPQQRQRFQQLDLQFRGLDALSDPAIQQRLNLTPAQQQQFRQLSTQWEQDLQKRAADAGIALDFNTPQGAAMRAQLSQRINSILTPEQRRLWTQMTGDPFEVPTSATAPQNIPTDQAVPRGTNQPRQPGQAGSARQPGQAGKAGQNNRPGHAAPGATPNSGTNQPGAANPGGTTPGTQPRP